MATQGNWTWLRVMAALAGLALVVSLFLPNSIMPPDRRSILASACPTLIGLAAAAETRQRTRSGSDG